jgi:hypothetical protein
MDDMLEVEAGDSGHDRHRRSSSEPIVKICAHFFANSRKLVGANEMGLVSIVPISREECSLPWRKSCEAGTRSVVEIQGRPWLMICRVGVDDVSQLDWESEYRRSVLRSLGCCHFVILWHCAFLNHDVMFA